MSALDFEGMLEKIGDRIHHEMTKKDITKEELVKRSGVASGTIYNIKHYKGNPTLKVLDKIARALDITLEDLCNSTGKK